MDLKLTGQVDMAPRVRAFSIHPGNHRAEHHFANGALLYRFAEDHVLDEIDEEQGYDVRVSDQVHDRVHQPCSRFFAAVDQYFLNLI